VSENTTKLTEHDRLIDEKKKQYTKLSDEVAILEARKK